MDEDEYAAYAALPLTTLVEIAYRAHLYAYNTVEAGGGPPYGAWNREEWLALRKTLEAAGLNTDPQAPERY